MADKPFPIVAVQIAATLAEVFRHQNKADLVEVLEHGKVRIEQTDYDGWDNGTDIYILFIELPVKLFELPAGVMSRIETNRFEIGGCYVLSQFSTPYRAHFKSEIATSRKTKRV
jgi:hypothetical protein